MNDKEIDLALSKVFGAECALENMIIKENRHKIRDSLEALYNRTGRSYFKPSGLLV